jgi:HAE1 family hydrophobic/amphiphilic exporter-1
VDNDKIITTYNGEPAVVLGIIRQTDGNTVALEKNILEALPALEKSLPSGLHLTVVNDQAQFVKAAVHDVQWTLVFAAILVVLVIFLFLNEASSTLIAVVSLPLSVIGTFALMHLFNYSLDNLSLMGLVLAVGFIIDDAVVVIENIMRHLENGMTRLKAALLGSKEIGFTVLAMTLSLVAVFIPIFFMGGIIGRLFSEFAGVVGIAILMSAVIALTLIPMLASRYLSVTHYGKSSFFTRYLERVRNTYIKSLQVALRYKKTVLSIGLLFCVGSFFLFNIIPKSFIPGQDTNILFASVQAPQGVTFEEFRQRQSSVAKLILKNKNVVGVISSIGQGQGGVSGSNVGRLVISLVPKEDRQDNIQTILTNLRNAVQNIQGLQINFMNPPSIRIGGKSNSSNYPFVLQGMDWKSLQEGTQSLEKSIKTLPGVTDIQDDLQMNNPELEVSILKDKAAQLGITPSQIESALYYAYGQSQISTIMQGTGEYDVIIDIDPRYQKNINDISHLSLTNAAGQSIPLNAVATFSETTGPLVINHYGQMPAVTLSFNLDKGVSLSQVADKIQTLAKTTLPPGVTGTFSGAAKTFSDSFATLPLLLLLTVIIIYMVLAILYESFIHPLTILTALPFAFFGALLSLFILHQPLDLFSFIGLIMLVGLTKKNGIMMVDFALTQRPQLSAEAAIVEACLVRFRPIMMTTMAAILATLPIALGLGAGGESRQALGVCVVGGLLFSQFITLYITPVIFVYLERWRK